MRSLLAIAPFVKQSLRQSNNLLNLINTRQKLINQLQHRQLHTKPLTQLKTELSSVMNSSVILTISSRVQFSTDFFFRQVSVRC